MNYIIYLFSKSISDTIQKYMIVKKSNIGILKPINIA